MKQQFADAERIFLVGYRGAGKSTVGLLLAQRLGWDFVDTDDKIIATSNRSIAELFDDPGEAGFRDLESAELTRMANRTNVVVATGGGIVLRPENRQFMSATGYSIWLQAVPAVLFRRIQGDPGTVARRPHLIAGGSLAEVEKLLPIREPLYQAVAQFSVDTSLRSPEEVVSAILASC